MNAVKLALLLIISSASILASAEDPALDLGNDLLSAIKDKDPIAFAHCWVSMRQMNSMLSELGVVLPEEKMSEMQVYMAARNRDIHETYTKVQKLLSDHSISTAGITIKSCIASNVREKLAPKGTLTKCSGFDIVVAVGTTDEIRMSIDDGVFDGSTWYFSDSPTNLFYKDIVLSFKDNRKDSNKAIQRTP
jgi:hypothetical protein